MCVADQSAVEFFGCAKSFFSKLVLPTGRDNETALKSQDFLMLIVTSVCCQSLVGHDPLAITRFISLYILASHVQKMNLIPSAMWRK